MMRPFESAFGVSMTAIESGLTQRPAHVPPERVVDFDMYAPTRDEADFHAAWRSLQCRGLPDVVWTPRNGGHWVALRGKVMGEVFNDYETFSSRVILVPKTSGEQHKLLPTTVDPPEHRGYRAALNPGLTPKKVRGLEETVRAVAIELIEAVRPAGACNFTTAYAEVLPIRIFLALVDLPMADAARLKYLSDQTTRPDGSMSFVDALQALNDYLEPTVIARRERPGDDLLSTIVQTTVPGRPLTHAECMNLCVQVLIAGLDTVVNFLGFMMLFLAQNHRHRHRLVAEPAAIPGAVEEFVRRFGVVSIARLVTRDVDFHGAPLREGEMILLPTVLHGLDDRENEDPMRVDFDRRSTRHSTFGQGAHHCVGAHLARAELRITLEEWLQRIPDFELAPGATIECQGGIVGCVRALPLVWNARSA
jgi:cytochrome P450